MQFCSFLLVNTCYNPLTKNSDNPPWVDNMIESFAKAQAGNPPQSIWRYNYNGGIVYYIPAKCCDQFSVLLTRDSTILCAPDGGFNGKGDEKCADFFEMRTNEELVWKDCRKE